jgi:hypothetical protein
MRLTAGRVGGVIAIAAALSLLFRRGNAAEDKPEENRRYRGTCCTEERNP